MKLDQLTTDVLFNGVRANDKVILSRAITLLESRKPAHREKAGQLLDLCVPFAGGSLRVGVTGVPGAGKSTFIEKMGAVAVEKGKRLAVLAVDPSSRKTGGSILGDKTRMEQLSQMDDVYIRPSPTGTTLGGVTASTRESITVLEAAGYDFIMVETVGVGQSEVAVHEMTDIFLLLLIACAGDELQGIKRGIMEMADIILVNKSDGDNVDRAKAAKLDIKRALHLYSASDSGWTTPVEAISSLTGFGLDVLWDKLIEYEQLTRTNGFFEKNRKQQALAWFDRSLGEELLQYMKARPAWQASIYQYRARVETGEMLPSVAIRQVLNDLFGNSGS
jgi:LAO/AO transport system kinase